MAEQVEIACSFWSGIPGPTGSAGKRLLQLSTQTASSVHDWPVCARLARLRMTHINDAGLYARYRTNGGGVLKKVYVNHRS